MSDDKFTTVVLKGIKTGREITIGIFKDPKAAEILANQIHSISQEGGFEIVLLDIEHLETTEPKKESLS